MKVAEEMHSNAVFLVPSVIRFADNPLSYSNVRSVFSPEERAAQTVRTMTSIQRRVPGAQMVLIEMGLDHAPRNVRSLADRYLYIGHRKMVREAVDGPHKGYGEAVGLLLADRAVTSLLPSYCFKLSGRYYLNDDFDISKWQYDDFMAKQSSNGWISTRLYGFPFHKYSAWRHILKQAIPFLKQGEAIENTLWRLLPNVRHIGTLGVSGSVAPWNVELSE